MTVSQRDHDRDVTELNEKIALHDELARERLEEFKQFIDQKFSSMHSRMLLYLGVAVGLIRFDLPSPVTGAALGLIAAKALFGLFIRH